jgi:hypothetical protein
VDELAHGAVGEPELLGDLFLRAALDGHPQQRLALALRQRGQGSQGVAHDRAALELLLGRVADLHRLAQLGVIVAAAPQGLQ